MTADSLRHFGTIAFDPEYMRTVIGFGEPVFSGPEFLGFDFEANPNTLCVSVWLAFVPEVYRKDACQIATQLVPQFVGQPVSKAMLDNFIGALAHTIWSEVQPR